MPFTQYQDHRDFMNVPLTPADSRKSPYPANIPTPPTSLSPPVCHRFVDTDLESNVPAPSPTIKFKIIHYLVAALIVVHGIYTMILFTGFCFLGSRLQHVGGVTERFWPALMVWWFYSWGLLISLTVGCVVCPRLRRRIRRYVKVPRVHRPMVKFDNFIGQTITIN